MKSHVINYIEMPIKAFAEKFPKLPIPSVINLNDPYVVRINAGLKTGSVKVSYILKP